MIIEAIRLKHIEYVFYNPKTLKPWNNVRKSWITLKKRAGIDLDFRIHDLRHSFACKLMDKGANIGIIRELLVHGSLYNSKIFTRKRRIYKSCNKSFIVYIPCILLIFPDYDIYS